ncbi:MAG: hypothetical protein ACFFCS_06265 [Candidatus Hodarchaeota archaeon]
MPVVDLEFYPSIGLEELKNIDSEIKEKSKKWPDPFFFKPRNHFDIDKIREFCDPIIKEGIENVIVLGTGGSIQTMLALQQFADRNVYPITSSRPAELKAVLKDPSIKNKAVVVSISRGGETLDVNSVIHLFYRYKNVALSSRGTMYNMLKNINTPMMDVPDLAGRFAASCTNVALVPAYLAGIDINTFVTGLEEGYNTYQPNVTVQTNPAKQFAVYLYKIYKNGLRNVFSMIYSSWLEGAVGLWVQELSESTGKEGLGLIGTSQAAPLAQHSVLELLLGGSKMHTLPILWTTEKDPLDIPLNSTIPHIQGKTAAETVLYQANATFEALLTQGSPAAMIEWEIPTVKNIGHLIAFIQSTIYYLCMFFDVNWSDNPNVLLGKKICNEAMASNKAWAAMKQKRKSIAEEKLSEFWVF